MLNKIKPIILLFLLILNNAFAAPLTPIKIEKECNQEASKEERNFEKNYLSEMERYNKKEYEVDNLIDAEKRMTVMLMLSSFCNASYHASKKGLEKETFSDYMIEEFEKGFTKSDLDNARVAISAVLLKPAFIRMINFGYTLSDQD